MTTQNAMHRCLELAKQGRGLVGTNPLVGCVLVRGNKIIAEGYYRGVGSDHAEVDMIKNCEQDISPTDRLYVNLEPCNHTGNTPPCTEAIINAGIKHVTIGMIDPDKRVAGQGIAALRSAGVQVEGPVARPECERLNRGYISVRTKGRPFITLKRAQTKDGQIANEDGSKLCITSDQQNKWSHTKLRTTHDAILIGVQTVITDDPQLTIRLNKNLDQSFPQPKKIILDPQLRIPTNAKLIDERAIIVTHSTESIGNAQMLQIPGAGEFDLLEILTKLVDLGISSVLVEGGAKTWEAFTKVGLVDEEVVLLG